MVNAAFAVDPELGNNLGNKLSANERSSALPNPHSRAGSL
jgi:hypothetical protein